MIFVKAKKIIQRYSPEFIKIEDLFLAEKIVQTSDIQIKISEKRSLLLLIIIAASLIFLIYKTFDFAIIQNRNYSQIAFATHHKTNYNPSPRGVIFDRNGKALAVNKQNYEIYALPNHLPKTEDLLNEWIKKIAQIISVDEQSIKNEFSRHNIFLKDRILLLETDDIVKAELFKEKIKGLQGLEIVRTFKRFYPYAPYASHVIGYVTQKNEFKQEGAEGIEMIKNKELDGTVGKEIYRVDAKGNIISKELEVPAIAGKDVYLTIDIEAQKMLEDIFEKYLKEQGKKAGAAVLLNPKDSSIIALASFPRFDNNNVSRYLNDESKPLFNRAISGQYPSGSVIKPAVALAALKENIISPDKNIFVTGSISVTSEFNQNIKYVFKDWQAHGYVDMQKAIAVSSNVYFYTIGGGYQDFKGLGPEKLSHFYKLFGLGAKTGIDLPSESYGLVPTPEWKQQHKNEKWYIGDTYHISIGQGDLKVTPLQIAVLNQFIANATGVVYKPHILKDQSSVVTSRIDIDPEDFKIVQKGMRLAVTEGSAKALSDLPIKVAGKTGTAQVGLNQEPHSWFSAFAPYDDPSIVIVAIVENGGEGTKIAVPIVKDFLKLYFMRKD